MQKQQSSLKKNDTVKVIAGKDKGKIRKVIKAANKKNRVLVEKVNMVKHHRRPSAQMKQGGIIEAEAPIHASNLMLMCTKCNSPIRVKMQRLDDGKKVRVCRKCNEIIDS